MTRYWVCFGPGKFDDPEDALSWARDVGETDRLVLVVKPRLLRAPELVAVFPPEPEEEGKRLWRVRGPLVGAGP